ncbi:MAG: ATP-binding protein [Planctomycetes bacterium]|nr:ATP-binding protein [Planctomycetota bacterium]
MINEVIGDFNPWWTNPNAYPPARPNRRDLFEDLYAHLARADEHRAIVLMGPRQVGKTTLLHQLGDSLLRGGVPRGNLTYFDFSDDRITEAVSPRGIVDTVSSSLDKDKPRFFLFDEISRAQRWDAWLKQAVATPGHRYLVTDSAASLLREGSTESGPGRWDEFHIEGLSFAEFLRLQAAPDEGLEEVLGKIPNALVRYLMGGGFPEHIGNDSPSEVRRRLRSDIADRAILRDLARRKVRDLGRIKDLFVYLVQDSGAILDVRARAEALQVGGEGADPRSVLAWVRILEETRLLMPLEQRTGSPAGRLKRRAKPRVYAADHSLVWAFVASADPLTDPRDKGRIYEAVVFRHLRDVARAREGTLSYFRQDDDQEVDFILEALSARVAIEVTSSREPEERKKVRLREAGKAVKADRLVLIHDGFTNKEEKGILLIPLRDFLLDPARVMGA